jgi:hypothetical protein
MSNTTWILGFCNAYAPLALSLAKLFVYAGLTMGVILAAAEAYKLYREARAITPAGASPRADAVAANPAVSEIIKGLVGLLTGAKAWLALVILGILLLWLAGNAAPHFCTPPPPPEPQSPPRSAPPAPVQQR